MVVAGCSSIDIISILKKQRQETTSYKAEIIGEREQQGDASPFKTITLVFSINGIIDPEKVQKAAQLSFEKYCSVSKMLEKSTEIKYELIINSIKI
jgi:putative redox protein